jgi:hypothetical protein
MAGLTQEQIFIGSFFIHFFSIPTKRLYVLSVGSHKRRGCMLIEDGYSQHLQDLQTGKIAIAQPVISPAGGQAFFPTTASLSPNQHPFVSRTVSFTPRSGKYREKCDSLTTTTMSVEKEPKKHSQISTH